MIVLALLALSALSAPGAAAKRVRGVPDEEQALFQDASGRFSCRDGSGSVPLAQVNDEYCDCADGSDEPGTAACPGGRFYCANAGHQGRHIFASRVRDGVCDCCDGSDEAGSGGVFCPDTCAVEAEESRAALAGELEVLKRGLALREAYVAKGRAAASGDASGVEEAQALVAEREAAVAAAKEAVEREEAQEATDRELRSAVDAAGLAVELGLDLLSDLQLREMLVSLARRTEGGSDALHALIREALPDVADADLPAVGSTAGDGDFKRPEAEAARSELKAAETALRTAKNDLRNKERDSGHDYGADNQYFALKGQCFSHEHQGYKYEVCPYNKAKQGSTSLGTFQKLEGGAVLKFANGQSCWQGPKRSITVQMRCGEEDALIEVSEPSKCEYHGVLTTPAACDPAHAEALGMELL